MNKRSPEGPNNLRTNDNSYAVEVKRGSTLPYAYRRYIDSTEEGRDIIVLEALFATRRATSLSSPPHTRHIKTTHRAPYIVSNTPATVYSSKNILLPTQADSLLFILAWPGLCHLLF